MEKEEMVKSSKAKPSNPQEMETFSVSIGCSPGQGETLFLKLDSIGWKNNGRPIKNWQSLVRTWHRCGYMPIMVNRESNGHTVAAPPEPEGNQFQTLRQMMEIAEDE